ncbi:MAG: family 20 glycosylhydrolase [Propionicimonas sp.]
MAARPALIPRPSRTTLQPGRLAVESLHQITVGDPASRGVAELFRSELERWTGLRLPPPVAAPEARPGAVHLRLVRDAAGPDALPELSDDPHRLIVSADGIEVTAGTLSGLHRGLSSVIQLLATGDPVPALDVADRAVHVWRGLSLDVARFFVGVDEVRRIIDLLSLYKLNVLHLHLTENEGWRLQVRSWPLLTEQNPPGTYYTQEEFAGLVAYAAERFVTIVPEIDLPGHALSVIQAYPELGATPAPGSVFPAANLDVGTEIVERFVRDVLGEVAELTPGPFLHIGGDETFGMDDADQAAFATTALRLTGELGKTAVGWQEMSRGGVRPHHVVQHWIDFAEDPDAGQPDGTQVPAEVVLALREHFVKARGDLDRIARSGARVLLSPCGRTYLDRRHLEESSDPGQAGLRERVGFPTYPRTALRTYYDWNPQDLLGPVVPERVVGIEAAVWGETITSYDDLEILLLPRLVAVAEVAWSPPETRDWADFQARLAAHPGLWDRQALTWFRTAGIDWRA